MLKFVSKLQMFFTNIVDRQSFCLSNTFKINTAFSFGTFKLKLIFIFVSDTNLVITCSQLIKYSVVLSHI